MLCQPGAVTWDRKRVRAEVLTPCSRWYQHLVRPLTGPRRLRRLVASGVGVKASALILVSAPQSLTAPSVAGVLACPKVTAIRPGRGDPSQAVEGPARWPARWARCTFGRGPGSEAAARPLAGELFQLARWDAASRV